MEFYHKTVLLDQLVDGLTEDHEGGLFIDCTTGGGGHSEKLLQQIRHKGRIIAIDQDMDAIKHLRIKFKEEIEEGSVELVHSRFSDIKSMALNRNLNGKIQGIFADIGISSHQVDNADRGFSFLQDGPLDMRMDRSKETTAADIINSYSLEELARIFREYGDEPKAYFVAKTIVHRRSSKPFLTTHDLANTIESKLKYKSKSKKHPATRVFQALRIEVNNELGELEILLSDGFEALSKRGRMAIITFHSLEDRIVKNFIKNKSIHSNINVLSKLPITNTDLESISPLSGRIIKPFPIKPSDEEIRINPRSRSAKLRIIEKL